MSKKPDWMNDSDFDIEPVVIFKTETVHFLTFLDEGEKGTAKIIDKTTKKEKIIPCVNFIVNENGDEKKFNPIAKNLIKSLEMLYPLINRTFRIELVKGRTEIDNTYKINELNE